MIDFLCLFCGLQIWVYGNSFESFLVAVVNPNQKALEQWAEENGVSGDFKSVCENLKAKEYILGELTKTGKEKKVLVFFCCSNVCILSHFCETN